MTLCSEWFAGEWFCMVECVSERVVVSGKKGELPAGGLQMDGSVGITTREYKDV